MVLRKDNEIAMCRLQSNIKYKPLSRIAPSHFYAMVQCPYKIVLAEAFERHPLIPLSPNAYIGSVFHKLMEMIVKGQLTDDAFNEVWESEIKSKENELWQEGITFCLPLKNHVQNIGLKKILIRNQIKKNPSTFTKKNKDIEYISEKWLQNEDGTVGGMLDLITRSGNIVSISDFKTGKLTNSMVDESGEIVSLLKEEYEYQLKLYAQLYFINYKVYPDHLYLIDMNNSSIEVDFTRGGCLNLYDQAIDLLTKVNTNIMEGNFSAIANCSRANCKYCLFRPACCFYHSWLPTNLETNDIIGELVGVKRFLNGNINVTIEINGKLFSIVEIDSSFNITESKLCSMIGFYGLKRKNDNTYSMNRNSCIYGTN